MKKKGKKSETCSYKPGRLYLFITFFTILMIQACDPNMFYDVYQKTNEGMWHYDDKKIFEAEVSDSLQPYNLLVNIRHTTDYPYENLFILITTVSPAGVSIKDTLEIMITNEKGKWYGYGYGKIKHISRMYKNNIRFQYPGNYKFILEQGVRAPEVPVTDVGFRIEKYKYPK